MRSRWLLIALLALGCSDAEDVASPSPESAPLLQGTGPTSRSRIIAAADARQITPSLEAAALSADAEVRESAVRAIGHIQTDASLRLLRNALRDPSAEVRSAAGQGLTLLSARVPVDLEPTLLAALASERELVVRAHFVQDLGRIGTADSIPAIIQALADDHPFLRTAACIALSEYGLRGRNIPEDVLRRASTRMVDDPDATPRLHCAHALETLPLPVSPDARRALQGELLRALSDSNAEVRLHAIAALAAYPDTPRATLARHSRDEDWRVRIQAFRSLARLSRGDSDRELAEALRFQLNAWSPGGSGAATELRVLLEAMRLARPLARNHATYQVAQAALARFAALPEGGVTEELGLLHCAAAALVDHGRSWPSRLEGCGHGAISDGYQKAEIAGVLAAGRGSEPQRIAYLERLFAHPDERVRESVLAALPSVLHPRSARLLLQGLEDPDPGVMTTALRSLRLSLARWASLRLPEGDAKRPDAAALAAALETAHRRLLEADHLRGLSNWLDVLAALPTGPHGDRIRALAVHWNADLRTRASSILGERSLPGAQGAVADVPNPIDLESIPRDAQEPWIRIDTPRGQFVLALHPEVAPVTVARFLGLVDSGFYEGLTFHRVQAAEYVEAGDPRGDGLGGPGWYQRSEESREAFARGAVGMSLTLRDGAGSQFFIAQRNLSERSGRYTQFAWVVRGMEVVDALLPGDTIDGTTRVSREAYTTESAGDAVGD